MPVIGHRCQHIRYKCRSHFIKQIYELAAIIDLDIFIRWNRNWSRSRSCSRNWCRERGAVLIRSVCVVALTTMSHVACGTIGWTIVRRQSRRPRVITQSLIQMPGHRHRQRSAIAPRLPIVPLLPLSFLPFPLPGTDVDACSCA